MFASFVCVKDAHVIEKMIIKIIRVLEKSIFFFFGEARSQKINASNHQAKTEKANCPKNHGRWNNSGKTLS